MMPVRRILLAAIVLFSAAIQSRADESADASVTFYKDVQPILKRHCTICHNDRSVAELNVSGGLSLSSPDGILESPKITSVTLGKPDESTLFTRLLTDDAEKRMPKDDEPLSADKIETIRRWIESGGELGKPEVSRGARKRSKPKVFLDLTLPTNVTPPADAFGDIKSDKLSLVASIGPLAPVTALAFSDDGKWLACGSYRRIVVWDLASATAVAVLDQPLGIVHSLAFTPDSKKLYFAGGDPGLLGEIGGIDVDGWTQSFSFQEADDVMFGMAISPDGHTLATVSFDRHLRIFALPEGELRHDVQAHSDFAYSAAFSADGKFLLTAGKDTVVKRWDPQTAEMLQAYGGHNDEVYAAIFSPDSNEIYSTGAEPQIFKFDAERGDRPQRQGGHGGVVYQLAWDKERNRFVSGGSDTTVRTWLPGARPEKTLRGAGDVVYSVALSPDQRLAAAGSWDGRVRIWSLKTDKIVLTLMSSDRPDDEPADWLAMTEHGYYSASAALSDRSRWIMSGKPLPYDKVSAALARSAEVAKALQEEELAPITFGDPESAASNK